MTKPKDDKVFVAKCGCLVNNSSGIVDLFPCKDGCHFQMFVIAYMKATGRPVVDVYEDGQF